MKTKLIIINWLFAWVPLCYVGNDPVIAFCIVGWFGFASHLLNKNQKEVEKEMEKFEKKIDKLINKQKAQ